MSCTTVLRPSIPQVRSFTTTDRALAAPPEGGGRISNLMNPGRCSMKDLTIYAMECSREALPMSPRVCDRRHRCAFPVRAKIFAVTIGRSGRNGPSRMCPRGFWSISGHRLAQARFARATAVTIRCSAARTSTKAKELCLVEKIGPRQASRLSLELFSCALPTRYLDKIKRCSTIYPDMSQGGAGGGGCRGSVPTNFDAGLLAWWGLQW